MIFLWRNPVPEVRRAIKAKQWWALALGLAIVIAKPTYTSLQMLKVRPGIPPASNATVYWTFGGLAIAATIILLLLLASLRQWVSREAVRDRTEPH